MTEGPDVPEGAGELMTLARDRALDALEAAWMKRLEEGPKDVEELFVVAEYLVRKKFPEPAGLLLWSLVMTVSEKGDTARALEIAKRASSIAPHAPSLRDELAALYKKSRPDVPELPSILESAGLGTTADIKAAVRCIERCAQFRPGSFVIHERSRRIGRVAGFQDGAYRIEAEGSQYTLPPPEAAAQWEPLDPEDFRALAAYDRDRLRRLAAEDPLRLVQMLLRVCNGRAEFKQLKFMLIPTVIPADGWSAWWNSVKVLLKRSPALELSGSAVQPMLSIRAAEMSYADQVRARFSSEADPFGKVKRVLEYLGEVDAGHAGDASLAEGLAAELLRLGRETADAVPALAFISAAAEIRQRFPSAPDGAADLAAKAQTVTDLAALVAAIGGDEVARMVLGALGKAVPERAPETCAAAFPGGSLRLCEWIARELQRAGREDLVPLAAEKVTAAPDQFPEAFGWVWRWVLSSEAPIPERFDQAALTVAFLQLMNRLARIPRHAAKQPQAREVLSKLRNLIASGECRLACEVIASSDLPAAKRLHEAIVSNEGLTAELRNALVAALRERYPEHFVERVNLWEDGHIHSTAEGLARRQAELDKLVNADMPKNAEAIGRAAAMGDLRENWEYKAALEERDRLVERAGRVREELVLARVIDRAQVTGEEVNVGTSVRLRDRVAGKERTITFLGPWEADIGHGVYSYLAPLSLRFMGRKVGDRVRASLGDAEAEYEVVAIEKIV